MKKELASTRVLATTGACCGKRVLSLLLAFMMVLALVPTVVFAEDTDTRTKVSAITATSNMDSIMKYGNTITLPPTFNITAGSPAYFDRDMYYWEKKDGTEWKEISLSTLTEGTYRFSIQIRIDGEYGKTHVLDTGGVSVTVDGVKWEGGSNPRVKSTYSYDYVRSKEYVIEAPEDAPFKFIQVDSLKIGTSWVNTAITPIDLAKYATGGTKPYKFVKGSGPDWLTVSSDGTISGTPTTAGANDDLVFIVSDSASARKVIVLTVEDTEIKPADRTKVSAIAATSNTDSIAVYGNITKIPTFSITEGSQAYFESGMCYWEKKNGTSWERYTGTFTEGTYRFSIQIRIDGEYGRTHVLDEDGVSVTVDGMKWADKDTPYVKETYSYVWVCSEEYAVTDGIEHGVTVINGKATYEGSEITKAASGAVVTITADPAEAGKQFDKWEVTSGGVTIADVNSATTTFTMGGENVEVKATYKDAAPSHTHTYGTEWKSDDTNHWKECTDTACTNPTGGVKDKAAHTASDWIIDTAATATADGAKHKECTVCHKVLETETIPATGSGHTHTYDSTWKSDDTDHWRECTDLTCPNPTGSVNEKAAHTASSWIIDTPATETTDGAKHTECTVCHKVLESATIPATGGGHTHAYGAEWKSDSTNHWHECACGDKADIAAHSFAWKIDREATKTETGLKHEECSVCGAKRNENTVIDKLPSSGGSHYYTGPSIYAIKTADEAQSATDFSGGIYGLTFIYTDSYGSFTGVQVDGKTISKSNYIAEDNGGNTEIYLKAVYLQTLAAGKHTVTALFGQSSASTEFTIGGGISSPKTFDGGISVYMLTAAFSFTSLMVVRKKKEEN